MQNNREMVEKQTYKKNKKNPRKRETCKSEILVWLQRPLLNPRKKETYKSEILVCMQQPLLNPRKRETCSINTSTYLVLDKHKHIRYWHRHETSVDVQMKENRAKACGGSSNAATTVLKENSSPLSNKEVLIIDRKILRMQSFKQHPCLYSTDYNSDAIFLCYQST
ncbi:unnamed protein product [Fraxinus pennsylvanica]|uniref:Uncharacterized protein n=1 Tax=Fraxinus pennsylvanica TaxID=56036 RepID=A0AAD2AGT6_9LAMI|nr:unnamed protein product [Fraxinus pennsylvanica]